MLFVAGTTARTAAELFGIHRNTATLFFRQVFDGEIEVDELYFGGARKGKRRRGAAGKVAVFGLLKRGGKVNTQMIIDCRRETLMRIIRRKIEPDNVVYSDTFASYNTLASQRYHTCGSITTGYWRNQAAAISTGSRTSGARPSATCGSSGVPKECFYLFLKEFELRFSTGDIENNSKVIEKTHQAVKFSRTAP